MSKVALGIATVLLTALGPGAAVAQAICSAPHSSPSLAGGGSLSTLLPGSGWIQLSGYAQNAGARFDHEGEEVAFFLEGRSRTRSGYLTGAIGVAGGVDLWAQVAVHRLTYADQGGSVDRTGVGDLRVAARVTAERFGLAIPMNLRAGVKVPGSDFPVDARVLPLSEGQPDLELSVESGRSFLETGVYAVGWAGHRWRLGESASGRAPADEWFGHLALGRSHDWVRWEFGLDLLAAGAPLEQGVRLVTGERRMVQLSPTLSLPVGPGHWDLTAQLPLAGRNLPSDPSLSMGYRLSW